jgi:hypothetical protein
VVSHLVCSPPRRGDEEREALRGRVRRESPCSRCLFTGFGLVPVFQSVPAVLLGEASGSGGSEIPATFWIRPEAHYAIAIVMRWGQQNANETVAIPCSESAPSKRGRRERAEGGRGVNPISHSAPVHSCR